MIVKLNKKEYRDYLDSLHWKNLRATILGGKPSCQVCQEKEAKDVHHMVYRNIVDIKVTDLLPVCRDCHKIIHQAIRDNYISQRPEKIDKIREKTLGILSDEKYAKYHKWLGDKHFLDKGLIDDIVGTQHKTTFLIRRISGILKKHVWFDNLHEFKFTGRQIEKIRRILDLVKKRRYSHKRKSNLFRRHYKTRNTKYY